MIAIRQNGVRHVSYTEVLEIMKIKSGPQNYYPTYSEEYNDSWLSLLNMTFIRFKQPYCGHPNNYTINDFNKFILQPVYNVRLDVSL